MAGTPEQGAVVARAGELVDFARRHGYRVDELVEIIETSASDALACEWAPQAAATVQDDAPSWRPFRQAPEDR